MCPYACMYECTYTYSPTLRFRIDLETDDGDIGSTGGDYHHPRKIKKQTKLPYNLNGFLKATFLLLPPLPSTSPVIP